MVFGCASYSSVITIANLYPWALVGRMGKNILIDRYRYRSIDRLTWARASGMEKKFLLELLLIDMYCGGFRRGCSNLKSRERVP